MHSRWYRQVRLRSDRRKAFFDWFFGMQARCGSAHVTVAGQRIIFNNWEIRVNKVLKYGALAVFVGVGAGAVAHADEATTTGGFKIKSSDGNFDASLGGRIHFDGLLNMPDSNEHKIGSGAADDANSDFEFRRVFISLGGHLYGYEYRVDYDLAASNFQDVWIAHSLLPGGTIYIGQHKPWRSMDEIASNNS